MTEAFLDFDMRHWALVTHAAIGIGISYDGQGIYCHFLATRTCELWYCIHQIQHTTPVQSPTRGSHQLFLYLLVSKPFSSSNTSKCAAGGGHGPFTFRNHSLRSLPINPPSKPCAVSCNWGVSLPVWSAGSPNLGDGPFYPPAIHPSP